MSSIGSQHQITTSILSKYYTSVTPLRTYLANILVREGDGYSEADGFWREGDSEEFLNLLTSSYVGVKEEKRTTIRVHQPMFDMREIIDQAQAKLFKSRRPQNIITSGYRPAYHDGERGKNGLARVGITNYFTNTTITAFHGPEWELLLLRIGENAMIHLLIETSIYISLPNGCLCQICGEPLIHRVSNTRHSSKPSEKHIETSNVASGKKRPSTGAEDDIPQRHRKRRKVNLDTTSTLKTLQGKRSSPADIIFLHFRLFYSKPNYIPNTKRMIVGLPLKHVLNRLHPSYCRDAKLKSVADDPCQRAEKTRHLSKYIFSRQYRLNTPFFSTLTNGSNFKFGDYLDRDSEIKALGHFKTPKRLKNILPLLDKLLLRHSRCGYVPLRDRACPSKIKTTGHKDLDSSIILELMSENSVQLRSQMSQAAANDSVDSAGNLIMPIGLTQAQKHVKYKPRFAEFSCSHAEVYRFVALVTDAIIPKSFWGSKRNLKVVLGYVKDFITCRRYESLSLHYVLQNFSTSDCDWLIPPGSGVMKQGRVSESDALKRRELLEDFILWYFDSFVLPLLKTNFYITESSAFRNQVLYFRHDDWDTLCAPLIERLTSVTFEKLTDAEAAEILRQRRLGFSFVRLLPKETGVRPIVNLRRRKKTTRGFLTSEQSINQILQAAFSILTFERVNQSLLLGGSIFSPEDIHLKLKKLKATLPRDAKGALPKLYFVKLDVQACFDTIEQTKLLQILRQIISEDVYMIQKYGQISNSLGRIKRTYVKKAVPEDDHPHFLQYATELANILRNTIIVDQVVYPLSKKQEILQLLEEHITENIVKIGSSYYRQTVGIPQGSVLSTILCSFFYGDLEKKFSAYTSDNHSLLLRLIDDYLFVTTSLTNAKGFLSIMKRGHPEYGCFISPDKTLTNFDCGDGNLNIVDPSQKTFPWCGYRINMGDLSITVDYTRYHGSGLRSTLTVDRGRRPGAAFAYKIMQLAKAKSHAIFSDRDLNTTYVVYLNMFQNLMLTAMKMHGYIRDWGTRRRKDKDFLRNVIQKTIAYNYTSVRGRARRRESQGSGEHTDIHKEAVVWLGHYAFHHVLSRAPQKYTSLVRWLEFEVKRPKYRHYLRRFKALVKEGKVDLAQITI